MKDKIIASALETISIESNAIAALKDYINDDFVTIANLIHKSLGRIILTGIGKSAIIAQKISATFNSTGTPALFMHAADAIHGDLVMIQKDDIVIVISKSGESPEIKALVPLIKRFGNKIIGLIGNRNGFLAKEADFIINSTIEREACLNNLAPTTSTTAQMVMGDALAVVLMELNQFTGRDFAKFHPGGNLGRKLYLTVAEAAKNNGRPLVKEGDSIKEVIIEITKNRLGVTAVKDDKEEIVGIITDGDLRRMMEEKENFVSIKAKDIATRSFKFVNEEMLAVQALEEFRRHDISQLLIMREKFYVGVLHLHDLVREGIF